MGEQYFMADGDDFDKLLMELGGEKGKDGIVFQKSQIQFEDRGDHIVVSRGNGQSPAPAPTPAASETPSQPLTIVSKESQHAMKKVTELEETVKSFESKFDEIKELLENKAKDPNELDPEGTPSGGSEPPAEGTPAPATPPATPPASAPAPQDQTAGEHDFVADRSVGLRQYRHDKETMSKEDFKAKYHGGGAFATVKIHGDGGQS